MALKRIDHRNVPDVTELSLRELCAEGGGQSTFEHCMEEAVRRLEDKDGNYAAFGNAP